MAGERTVTEAAARLQLARIVRRVAREVARQVARIVRRVARIARRVARTVRIVSSMEEEAVRIAAIASHAAIVTRELGIPSIIGVEDISKILKTGMRVRINSQTSKVEIL